MRKDINITRSCGPRMCASSDPKEIRLTHSLLTKSKGILVSQSESQDPRACLRNSHTSMLCRFFKTLPPFTKVGGSSFLLRFYSMSLWSYTLTTLLPKWIREDRLVAKLPIKSRMSTKTLKLLEGDFVQTFSQSESLVNFRRRSIQFHVQKF